MRKMQQPLSIINSSQLKLETTCSRGCSSPFLRYVESNVELLVCRKGAFLKGASLCGSVGVGDPKLLPWAS